MKISACCIIKNEEKNLPAYIEGIKNIADEIIITDTGSMDNSITLLENLKEKYNLNLKIYNFEWINDFAAAKNFTVEKASGDWIIFLDADEYFDKKYRKKVRELLEKINDDKSIIGVGSPLLNIDVNRDNLPLSTGGQRRIFRRSEDVNFEGAVHEHLWYKGKESVHFFESDLLIIHTGYSSDILGKKQERNKEIILKHKELANDENPVYYGYLAAAYYEEGKIEEAGKTLKKGIDIMNKNHNQFLVESYDFYIRIKVKLKAPKEEIDSIIDESLKNVPDHPDLLMHKLASMMENETVAENFEKIEKLCKLIFEKASDKELRSQYLNQTDAHLPYAHYVLGAVYKAQRKYKEAINEFLAALKSYRYRENVLTDLLELLEDNEKKAAKILKEYYDEKSESDKAFLEKVLSQRPRDNLYKTFCKSNRQSVDYKLSSGKIIDAIKLAAKELENAKNADPSDEDFRKNLQAKLYVLAISFFFLDVKEIYKVERELNLLPPSVIALILRFFGENLPPVEGEDASFNALKNTAMVYLPKNLRERFLRIR